MTGAGCVFRIPLWMTVWEYADRHPFVSTLCLFLGVYLLMGLIGAIGRRRDVKVTLVGADAAIQRDAKEDRPS